MNRILSLAFCGIHQHDTDIFMKLIASTERSIYIVFHSPFSFMSSFYCFAELSLSSMEALLFGFGVGVGVQSASEAHQAEVQRLNQLLDEAQIQMQNLKLELESRGGSASLVSYQLLFIDFKLALPVSKKVHASCNAFLHTGAGYNVSLPTSVLILLLTLMCHRLEGDWIKIKEQLGILMIKP
jgi:hypothetical protein